MKTIETSFLYWTRIAGFLVASLMLVNSSWADSSKTHVRTFEKVADGVYTIRHKDSPDTFPQGNTTVIIGEREVLVVDSCYLPSSAREDIAQIRQWTNKPVRYLVNTHWHFDHTMGNGTYWEAFPGITIVAHTETARQIAGYNPGWFERFPKRADRMRQVLAEGKDGNGKTLTDGERKEYQEAIAGLIPVYEEFKVLKDKAPTLSFDSELRIDLGGREVRIMYLGRGNTAGDAVIFLPKEKIIVTGDLVVHPVPYMFGGYPVQFAETLRRMDRLGYSLMIPGHGEVLRAEAARKYSALIVELLDEVTKKVSDEVHKLGSGPANLQAVRDAVGKSIDVAAWQKRFAGDVKDEQDFFDTTFAALITSAHAEVSLR